MRRLLFLTLEYPPDIGGVANYYGQLLRHLPADRVTVVTREKLLTLTPWIWPRWLKGLWTIVRLTRTGGFEHLIAGQLLPLGTIAWIVGRLKHLPYSVIIHGMDLTTLRTTKHSRKRRIARRILRDASHIIAASTYTKQRLIDFGAPAERITILSPATAVSGKHSPELSKKLHEKFHLEGEKILLSVSRLVSRKGIDTMITAMSGLHQLFPDLHAIIIGEGPDRARLETLVEKFHLGKFVTLVGAVDHETLEAWYALSDIFCLPAREQPDGDVEGFGMVFLEAALYGKPVIGTTSGGIPDAIVDGKTGFLIHPDDPLMLHDAVERLLRDPQRAAEMGAAGRARVMQSFQWQDRAIQFSNLFS